MSGVLTNVALPALALALSPLPAMVVLVLLVQNGRPRVSSTAYLAGRAVALTVLAVTFHSVPWLRQAAHGQAPRWVDGAVAGLGTALMVLGVRTWRRRHDAAGRSRWYGRLGEIPPPVAAALGLFPPLANPKVIAASAVADQVIAASATAAGVAALACYVAVACSTVAAPIAIYLVAGPRIDPRLEQIRQRIHTHRHATSALTLTIVGVAVIVYALA